MSMREFARSLALPLSLIHLALKIEEREAQAQGVPIIDYRGDHRRYIDEDGIVRCAARTRVGHPCKRKGLGAGHRCPNHGGKSTGARTPEGRRRSLEALVRYRARRDREKPDILVHARHRIRGRRYSHRMRSRQYARVRHGVQIWDGVQVVTAYNVNTKNLHRLGLTMAPGRPFNAYAKP